MYHFNEFLSIQSVCYFRRMADQNHIPSQNVPGRYYVDDTCIDCDLCRSEAPEFFARHDPDGFTYVHRQPITEEEITKAEQARLSCPTDSIGNDRESASDSGEQNLA
jgi:ferredoxin